MDSYDPEKLIKIKAIILNSFENRLPLNVSRKRDGHEFQYYKYAYFELQKTLAPMFGAKRLEDFQKFCFIEGLNF